MENTILPRFFALGSFRVTLLLKEFWIKANFLSSPYLNRSSQWLGNGMGLQNIVYTTLFFIPLPAIFNPN
jgi:hypothetical protein